MYSIRVAAVLAGVAVAFAAPQAAEAGTVYSSTQWNAAFAKTIHADTAQSVTLPNGKILWVFGDTLQVNGVSTVAAGGGFPHSYFVLQQPGTLNLTPVAGKYRLGQEVPNWSDGTFFWMGAPVVDGGKLYVLGQRIRSPLTIVGSYMAVFDVSTLAFQKIIAVPGGPGGMTGWGGVGKGTLGWWLTGSHNVSCSNATNCKVGDGVWVPFGHLGDTSQWQLHYNNMPAALNLGTTIGLFNTGAGYDAFTKTGDQYGGTTIEKLHAATPTSTWTVVGSVGIPSPVGTVTYGVAVHPEQAAPAGQIVVSYNVNGVAALYGPRFLSMTK